MEETEISKYWKFRQLFNIINWLPNGVLFLILINGMQLCAILLNSFIDRPNWAEGITLGEFTFTLSSLFIGFILGSIIVILAAPRIGHKNVQLSSASLYFVVGVIPFFTNNDLYVTILSTNCASGIAGGMAMVSFIHYTSETTPSCIRGLIMSRSSVAMIFGALIHSIVVHYFNKFDEILIRGILTSIFVILGGLSIKIFTFNSFVVSKRDDLQSEDVMTNHKTNVMIQYKNYSEIKSVQQKHIENILSTCLEDDLNTQSKEYFEHEQTFLNSRNLKNLLCLVLLKISEVLTYNLILNFIIFGSYYMIMNTTAYFIPTLAICKMTGLCISSVFVDKFEMKSKLILFGGIGSALMFAISGILFFIIREDDSFILFRYIFVVASVLFVIVGIGVTNLPNILSSELFPNKYKLTTIAGAQVFESSLQILMIFFTFHLNYKLQSPIIYQGSFITSVIMCFIATIAYLFIHENIKIKSLADDDEGNRVKV